jgi:hypothetical protein
VATAAVSCVHLLLLLLLSHLASGQCAHLVEPLFCLAHRPVVICMQLRSTLLMHAFALTQATHNGNNFTHDACYEALSCAVACALLRGCSLCQ